MFTRFHKLMIAPLAVQIALAVVMRTRADEAAPLKEHPLLAGFDAATVTRIQIADKDGKPVQGAHLALSDMEGRPLWPSPQGPKEGVLQPTDAEGKASVALLPAAKLVVEVRKDGKKARGEVALTAGAQAEIALVLP